MFSRKKREIRKQVERYNEGRRLMREGDEADEWYGMKFAREALYALVDLGCDETGKKCSNPELDWVLRKHGLSRVEDG